ncbi:MAG: sugar ABC transporter permease [Chloroflexi bacterium]|nr:sugar ABC transporter permease [Chloroflexota bacterium]
MTVRTWGQTLARRTYKRRDSDSFWGPMFMVPAILLLVLFRFYPLLRGIGYSLTDWDGIHAPEFIGLANFERLLFNDPLFRDSVANWFKVILTLPIWVLLPLVLALLIHQKVPGARFFRAAFFLPYVLSAVIVAAIFTMVLKIDGAVNSLLKLVGLDFLTADWLGTLDTALPSVIGVALWASFGVGVIIYLAALATMDNDLIDAATVDGANWFQMLWHIVFPSIRPTIEFYTVLQIKLMLAGMFAYVFVLTSGGPGSSTYLPEYLIWENMGLLNRPGYATAIGTLIFIFFLFVIIAQVRLMTQRD